MEEHFRAGKENRWIEDSHPFAFELNAIIKKRLDVLQMYRDRQNLNDNVITLDGISEHFYKKSNSNLFNQYVAEYMKTVKGKSLNTLI